MIFHFQIVDVAIASFSAAEKDKEEKLMRRRQVACERAFGLLISAKYTASVNFQRFSGLMAYLNPAICE
jgi:hypothetical protein